MDHLKKNTHDHYKFYTTMKNESIFKRCNLRVFNCFDDPLLCKHKMPALYIAFPITSLRSYDGDIMGEWSNPYGDSSNHTNISIVWVEP